MGKLYAILAVLSVLTVITVIVVKYINHKYATVYPKTSGDTSLDAEVEMDELDI